MVGDSLSHPSGPLGPSTVVPTAPSVAPGRPSSVRSGGTPGGLSPGLELLLPSLCRRITWQLVKNTASWPYPRDPDSPQVWRGGGRGLEICIFNPPHTKCFLCKWSRARTLGNIVIKYKIRPVQPTFQDEYLLFLRPVSEEFLPGTIMHLVGCTGPMIIRTKFNQGGTAYQVKLPGVGARCISLFLQVNHSRGEGSAERRGRCFSASPVCWNHTGNEKRLCLAPPLVILMPLFGAEAYISSQVLMCYETH